MDPILSKFFENARQVLATFFPGTAGDEITIKGKDGRKLRWTLPDHLGEIHAVKKPTDDEPFVPNAIQAAILEALDGKGMRGTQLGVIIGNKSQVYQRPGGIAELIDLDMVRKHSRLGYYRPDAPPPELNE